MIKHAKYRGFQKLRLEKGRFDCQYRLIRENNRTFGHGVNIAREFEVFQPFDKFFPENVQPVEVFQIFLVEVQIVDVVHDLFQPRAHCVFEFVSATIKNVEARLVVGDALFQISVHHREFVKVGKQG